ncbi:hypothetical protein LTR93_004058 [Exophiala xenobiotica]|nr:hypothetical protein LTR93_004058 [Exophiala xenobiotica]
MTTIPSFAFQDVDAPHLDDKMDVASSPFRQADDIDIDLDSVRDPSVVGSVNDDMIDDEFAGLDNNETDLMQDQPEEPLPDDDMIDDADPEDIDFSMDGDNGEAQVDEDEDILYEEEEEIEQTVQATGVPGEINLDEEPQNHEELGTEVDLVGSAEVPEAQDTMAGETDVEPALGATGSTHEESEISEDIQATAANVVREMSESPAAQARQAVITQQEELGQQVDAEDDFHLPTKAEVKQSPAGSEHAEQYSESVSHAVDPSALVSKELEASGQVEEPHVNQAQGLHPVTLVYLDEEMSLFPPLIGDASAIYFLQDPSLASEPLDKLLSACREILTGTLDHHDELVLDISSLGLHICEDSKYASLLSLSQIVETYLQLCHNDGSVESPPLYCYLSSRVSLASQYAYLSYSATEGKGFSEVAADYVDTPESAEHHAETAEDEPEAEGDEQQEASVEGPLVNIEATAAAEPENLALDEDATAEDSTEQQTAEHIANQGAGMTEAEAALVDALEEPVEPVPIAQETVDVDVAPETDLSGPAGSNVDDEREYPEAHDLDELGEEPYVEPTNHHQLQSHEDETNSSHTLEAYPPENETGEAYGDEGEVENLFDDSYEHVDLEHDEAARQPQEEFEPYNEEELFPKDEEGRLIEDEPATALEGSQTTIALELEQQKANVSASSKSTPVANGSHTSPAPNLQPPQPASPPITPAKNMHIKRKVDDDDELDLLEFDTPEPKRRRPS